MEQKIIAVVAGREIKESDFEKFLQNVPREQQAYLSNPQFRQQCLDQFVALHMFAELGGEMKLEETEEYQEMVENAKRDILAQMTMREVMKDAVVTEEDEKVYIPISQQEFLNSLTFLSIDFTFFADNENPLIDLYFKCRPDYFLGHVILCRFNNSNPKTYKCIGLEG